ncbi:GFA family protein [Marinomonas colpomeniae]|uniref:GFA family protein n=1 Tax=Marinomonas colpomeniae TaxID=2774408 RepID=A0ABR8NVT2_9GAMM|nr:GFA family protein [Marinomonas colpomeniae]
MINGSCLCGQCRYKASGNLFDVMYCHCSNCQKITGSAFAIYGGVSQDDFEWLCDLSKVREFHSSQYVCRYFCNSCGSMISAIDKKEKNTVYLSIGLLDSDTAIVPEYHQYVSSKAEWYKIIDNLPQYMAESPV